MESKTTRIQNQLLVMDAQAGSRVALEELVRRWYQRLWQHARRLTSDPLAAWDITQKSWYDVIRGLRRLEDPARFQAWAYRITTHRTMDWLRSRERHRHSPLPPVGSSCESEGDSREVREVLQLLGEKSRLILTLYYWEDLSVAEISITLDIPPGTVKSRLFQARGELKRLWESKR